jgi:hypothetical protein
MSGEAPVQINLVAPLAFVNSSCYISVMNDVRGYVREILPRYKVVGQRAAMDTHGITMVIQESKRNATGTRADLLRMVAKGRLVAVQHLFLLADPRTKSRRGGTRQDLWATVDKIEAGGGVIWELSTGRRTDDRRQRDEMMRDAVEALALGRHKTSQADKRGRPPKSFDDATLAKGRAAWESRKHKRWQDAAAALPEGMTARDAWRLFGPRNTET